MANHIVIGANFGDEGKGLVTHYLSSGLKNNIVVRFNGGAQAAHTVELEDGRRHVFHHIGSGTLVGAPTFLSEYFISNPVVFNREYMQVPEERVKVFAHRSGMLTTPYDWLLNQRVESARGREQHGTTGMGINETVTRVSKGYGTYLGDIYDFVSLKKKLEFIRDEYVPGRAKFLGIDSEYIMNYDITDYILECDRMSRTIMGVNDYNLLKTFDNIVFEGAQGLLLDEFHYFFPHVTRSRTGIENATSILAQIGQGTAEAHYVTRSYLTRHGNGPLPLEGLIKEKEDITNRPNKHQHELRFAPLNLTLLEESIRHDLKNHNGLIIKPNLKFTWGNHKEDATNNKKEINISAENLGRELFNRFPEMTQTWFYDKVMESGELK